MNNPLRILSTTLAACITLALLAPAAWADKPALGEAKMKTANEAAAKVVTKRLQTERPADFAALQQVKSAEIIVITGTYDRVEDVLQAVQVPFLPIAPQQLDQIELDARQLVMVNCPGHLSPEGIEKLRRFVKAGGFLYTTDWALTEVVEKAFPGFIAYNQKPTGNDVVEVQVHKKDNAFLRHLQLSKENPKWWLESSSYPIKVLKPAQVEVLIQSREMGERYGEAPVAVLFSYGDGKVLHIASHFYLQQNELRTVAERKKGDQYLKDNSALPAAVAAELSRDQDIQQVDAGDLQSSYAAQQMTTNLVIERKKDQARVEGLYGKKLNKDKEIQFEGEGAPKPVKKGERLKVTERKGGKVKVQTLSGDEAWVDEGLVE